MKFYSGEAVEIVLTPSQVEIDMAVRTASALIAKKLDAWILDRLTIEQLERLRRQIDLEIEERSK